jgi:hypothetical protein
LGKIFMERTSYLKELERKFLAVTPREPAVVARELSQVEARGGVYGIWEGATLRYFGETCHLNHRVFEIVAIGRHHSLNLLMGAEAIGKKGKEKSAWLAKSPYTVAWMVVDIGRTELEEYMVLKHATTLRNHQGIRFAMRGDIADWHAMLTEPNKAPEPTTGAVTPRAPSSTSRASPGRGSS